MTNGSEPADLHLQQALVLVGEGHFDDVVVDLQLV